MTCSGPGNNGGDGLVAARHLKHFGHHPTILYPKRGKNPFFSQLCKQCDNLNIPILSSLPATEAAEYENIFNEYDLIVDALFGFSFKGPAKPPYDLLLKSLGAAAAGNKQVLSVDIPSGFVSRLHVSPSV